MLHERQPGYGPLGVLPWSSSRHRQRWLNSIQQMLAVLWMTCSIGRMSNIWLCNHDTSKRQAITRACPVPAAGLRCHLTSGAAHAGSTSPRVCASMQRRNRCVRHTQGPHSAMLRCWWLGRIEGALVLVNVDEADSSPGRVQLALGRRLWDDSASCHHLPSPSDGMFPLRSPLIALCVYICVCCHPGRELLLHQDMVLHHAPPLRLQDHHYDRPQECRVPRHRGRAAQGGDLRR